MYLFGVFDWLMDLMDRLEGCARIHIRQQSAVPGSVRGTDDVCSSTACDWSVVVQCQSLANQQHHSSRQYDSR